MMLRFGLRSNPLTWAWDPAYDFMLPLLLCSCFDLVKTLEFYFKTS